MMGAIFVKRQSSSLLWGRSRASKRSAAAARRAFTQSGASVASAFATSRKYGVLSAVFAMSVAYTPAASSSRTQS